MFGHRNEWIARSQISPECRLSDTGDEGTLLISVWLYDKKEFHNEQYHEEEETKSSSSFSSAPTPNFEMIEAKRVFRKLAHEHHPDHGGNPKVMQALNELWAAVTNDVKGR